MSPELPLVLVVDDDPLYRALWRHAAVKKYRVQELPDASMITQEMLHQADILVLDLDMPDIDGIQFITGEQMADVARPQRPSLIISSGMEVQVLNLARRVAALNGVGCAAILRKPYKRDDVVQALARAADPPLLDDESHVPVASPERLARAMRDGQIEPWFQPQICLRSGQVVGVEVLARWLHPQWGVLSPFCFLGAAESVQLAGKFIRYTLDASLLSMQHESKQSGFAGRLSVNVSTNALTEPGFSDDLLAVLKHHDFPQSRLVCELTEHSAAQAGSGMLANMARLLMRGVTLSIDDFGTGYSNLGHLKSEAFSELKLGSKFVRDMMVSQTSHRITQGIVSSSRDSGLRVVAEGVEDRNILNAVISLGCTEAQGYLFAPPMPSQQLTPWLLRHQDLTIEAWLNKTGGIKHGD